MTLPQPGKPIITDTVRNIIAYTKENLDYIDGNLRKQYVVSYTRNAALAESTESITGVGFKPSAIITFSSNATADSLSFGVYGLSNINDNTCIYYIPSSGGWRLSSPQDSAHYNDASNGCISKITATGSDGFSVKFLKSGSPTGLIHFIALCLR